MAPQDVVKRRALCALLAFLVLTALHSYRDQWRDECVRKGLRAWVIEHRGNLYCIKGNKVLEWVAK